MSALAIHPNERAANAVRFQLLTGARIGEVLSARWLDVDLARGVWIKPSHHTKQNRTEHLPLSAPALALLAEMRDRAGAAQQYLFPGNSPGKPLRDIKSFGEILPNKQALQTTAFMTTATLMLRTLFLAVLA